MDQVYNKQQVVNQLLDMGYNNKQADYAYNNSSNKSLEGVIEYVFLNEHAINSLAQQKEDEQKQQQSQQQEQSQEKMEIENEKQPAQENTEGQSISDHCNKEFVEQLNSMGYSKIVAEKAVFMTQNKGIEQALQYIEQHKSDPDFEEELRIVAQQEGPKLTKEEAMQKARELQQAIREKKKKQEEEDERQREKNRILSGRQLTEAKRILEEQEIKRDLERKQRQKQEDEEYKKKLMLELQREKELRTGKKFGDGNVGQQQQISPIQLFQTTLNQIKTAHPSNLFPGMAKTALQTISIYVQNIMKDTNEEKFRKINLSNNAFQQRIGQVFAGVDALKSIGFKDTQDGFLFMDQPDVNLLSQALQILQNEINKF